MDRPLCTLHTAACSARLRGRVMGAPEGDGAEPAKELPSGAAPEQETAVMSAAKGERAEPAVPDLPSEAALEVKTGELAREEAQPAAARGLSAEPANGAVSPDLADRSDALEAAKVTGPKTEEPEPEPEPAAPPRMPSTVAEILAGASSAEHANELLHTYWEDYAAIYDNRALDAFNSKPKKGVELAIADGLCVQEARSIALFLLRAPGLDKTQV